MRGTASEPGLRGKSKPLISSACLTRMCALIARLGEDLKIGPKQEISK